MGWMETCAVDERMRFVMMVERQEETFAAVCRRFGVSRRTGYKWFARHQALGVEGLVDRSRAPLNHPQTVSAAIAERCLMTRRKHPTWGPVKVRAWLERHAPSIAWPAASTIGELFDREGLTVKRRLRRRGPPSSAPFAHCSGANDVWCIDFKGWFLTGDGTHCEPLTLSDAHSRYLLRCQALSRTDDDHVWPVVDAAFREFGLPKALRSDNGPPFASRGVGGLSKLSVKVIKAGVMPERIAPGKPQQNGRLERLHLTLLQDTAKPPARSLRQQLERFKDFQRVYNEERPHQALGNDTPAEHYSVAPRAWDGILREPEYSSEAAVRRVRHNGESSGEATRSTSVLPSSASRSASQRMRMAGRSPTDRSCLALSLMTPAIACASRNVAAVDLWTTQARCPQAHSISSNNSRPEQNGKCVTHVSGQNCYPCPRLLRGGS
jgi:putative transposase